MTHAPQTHVLLLTGSPGVGKTTVLRQLATRLAHLRCSGFYTEELREQGCRSGFRLVTLDGECRILAHAGFSGRPRVSRYGVDMDAIAAVARRVLAPRPEVELYLVDEIGRMECLSHDFTEAMTALLDSDRPVVATIALRGDGFIGKVKRRPDVELREVTRGNRAGLAERLLPWIEARLQAP